MSSFDKILALYRESDPYLADTLAEVESRFAIAKAMMLKLGNTEGLSDAELHRGMCDYYDRICDAFAGEFEPPPEPDNLTFGSDN